MSYDHQKDAMSYAAGGLAANVGMQQYARPRQTERRLKELSDGTMVRAIVHQSRKDVVSGCQLEVIRVMDGATVVTVGGKQPLQELRDMINETLETADALEAKAALDDDERGDIHTGKDDPAETTDQMIREQKTQSFNRVRDLLKGGK